MSRRFLTLSFVLSLVCACKQAEPASEKSEPKTVTLPANLTEETRMEWWREARFGMFIHWGLYAIPAGEWGTNKDHGEWIRTTAQIPVARYEEFQKQFNPVKFDADAWASMAADAGMKYLVITSKHHDGFCLFDSAQTDWDVMNTPFHRDVLKELSAACERHGVRFCTYHSIMDWHHPDYLPRRDWEKDRPTAGADMNRFVDYLRAQVSEVITKYHPGVMWFDGEWENTWTHERGVALYKLCRELDPKLIVNNRVDVHRGGMGGFSSSSESVGDFGTPEQEIPASGVPGVDWETCMTMNDHWGFNSHDTDWKSTQDIVRMLVDIASKGGNYLLNVGPRADGTFPPEAVERLREIGTWMKRWGDSIYGSSASPFDALEWGRCTAKERGETTTLYLHVFDKPASGELVLPGLANETVSAGWLFGPRIALPVERRGTDVVVKLAGTQPDAIDSVVALSIRGKPLVYRAPTIEAAADMFVKPIAIELSTGPDKLEIRYTLDGSDPTATSQLYTKPIKLDSTTTVSARTFDKAVAVSAATVRTFRRAQPWAAGIPIDAVPGLSCDVYDGAWDALPDFDTLTPRSTSIVPRVSVPPVPNERVGLRYRGYITVPADDVYVFALTSDDGADLSIGRTRIIDNDGLHSAQEKRGTAPLAAGAHPIEVRWFNKTGGAALDLKFAPLGEALQPIPDAALRYANYAVRR